MQKFNIGDKVKVTTKGDHLGWVDSMNSYIGKTGNIKYYDSKDNTYSVKFADGIWWWYEPDSLELVEPEVQQQVITNDTASELLTVEQAIHLLKSNGYKVYKEM